MSADRQRLTSAIRRIAKTDPEIRGILDAADNKGGKPGSAGVGSSTDAESQRICCDGSVSDNANPGVEERDPDADGAGQDGGLNSDDPAKLDMGEGTLSNVTDCATGEPICFDGLEFIPPDGWDGPSDPPPIEGYEEGIFYCPGERVSFVFQSRCDTCGKFLTRERAEEAIPGCLGGTIDDPGRTIFSFECPDGSTDEWCNPSAEDLLENGGKWNSDGCTNLIVKGGNIVGSKYDPENDGSYSAPRDSIDLCDSEGNQISLAPSANGGWKTINSTTNNGYLYDSSGQQIAHIDGNEYSDPSV